LEVEVRDYESEIAQMMKRGRHLRIFIVVCNFICALLLLATMVLAPHATLPPRLLFGIAGLACLGIAVFV